jgi:sugar phosphate permease
VTRLGSGRAWLVWATGVFAYLVAVFHRSSLGVAGVEAAQRFGISATVLAMLSLAQLFVYAALQVPVGMLLDRFGAKRLLVAGAVLMGGGQALFAVAGDVRTGLAARVLIGCGDAMAFISVLRLVALWFPPRLNPLVSQITALIGQFGAIASAVPLIYALQRYGWTPTFLGAAVLGALVAVVLLTVLRGAAADPSMTSAAPARSLRHVRRDLRKAWAEPGTRLGLWTHFVTQFPAVVFALLWGYPFLVEAEGLTPATAGLLLSLLTVAGVVCAPVVGHLVAKHPFHRSSLALAVVAASAVTWALVLLWPNRAPLPVLVLLVMVMAANGPGAMIGFDFARTFNPVNRISSATGIVNVGGWVASFITIMLIGILADEVAPVLGGDRGEALHWAFAVQYLVWIVGAVQVLKYRRRARRLLAERDPDAYDALRRGEVRPVRV